MRRRADKQPAADYDSPWKDALERYFEPFLALFFPAAHAEIDWSRPPVFLDKEFQKITRGGSLGRSYADKLARVWLKSGEEAWVLAHVEVQGEPEGRFPKRMYVYNYRIYDKHDRNVVSLAVLADDDPGWRPDRFEQGLWGSLASLQFPIAKLLDFRERWEELEASRNPFAIVVMAHLKVLDTSGQAGSRYVWKRELIRGLRRKGHDQSDVAELLRIIDWIMVLPEELEAKLQLELEAEEEQNKMPYVTSWERIGEKRGEARGEARGETRGLRTAIATSLEVRFGSVPAELLSALEAVEGRDLLLNLQRRSITAESLADFREAVAESGRLSHV